MRPKYDQLPCPGCGELMYKYNKHGLCRACYLANSKELRPPPKKAPRGWCVICQQEKPIPAHKDPRYFRICADCENNGRVRELDGYETMPRAVVKIHPVYSRGVVR
jgi:NMD protein affecting ribosome stability and mRNA decay